MFIKLKPRTFLIGLLITSSIWIIVTFLPLLYFVLLPPPDLEAIVLAMEGHGDTPPLQVTADFGKKLTEAGSLRRTIPVAYSSGIFWAFRVNSLHSSLHSSRVREVTYLARFEKLPKPMVLVVTSREQEGNPNTYEIDEGQSQSLIRSYGLPWLIFGLSLYFIPGSRRLGSRDPVP